MSLTKQLVSYLKKRRTTIDYSYIVGSKELVNISFSFTRNREKQTISNLSLEEVNTLILFLDSYKKGPLFFYRNNGHTNEPVEIPGWAKKSLSNQLQSYLNTING